MTIVRGRDGIGRRGGRPRKYSDTTIALAKAAVAAGLRPKVVAMYLNASASMVHMWCRDARFAKISPNPAFNEGLERLFGE